MEGATLCATSSVLMFDEFALFGRLCTRPRTYAIRLCTLYLVPQSIDRSSCHVGSRMWVFVQKSLLVEASSESHDLLKGLALGLHVAMRNLEGWTTTKQRPFQHDDMFES